MFRPHQLGKTWIQVQRRLAILYLFYSIMHIYSKIEMQLRVLRTPGSQYYVFFFYLIHQIMNNLRTTGALDSMKYV